MSQQEERGPAADGLDRRSAIRRGLVGAAAAGVVWSAPRVEGLTLRPNYAAAQTGGFGLDLMVPGSNSNVSGACGGGLFVFNGGRFDSEGVSFRGNFSYLNGAAGTINAVTYGSPPVADGVSFNNVGWNIFSPPIDADSILVHVEYNCT